MRVLGLGVSLLGVSLAAACGHDLAGDTAAPGEGNADAPILNGSAAPNDEAVVALEYRDEGFFCTGTLITKNVVLTAAHCLIGLEYYPEDVHVRFGADLSKSGERREVARLTTHPDFDAVELTRDIALLELADPAPADVKPIPALPAAAKLKAGDQGKTLRFVGYGLNDDDGYGERLQFSGKLGSVCRSEDGCTFMGWPVTDDAVAYSQTSGGTCSGDSGGPAFFTRSGKRYVAAVTSYGDGGCRYYGVSTAVDAYEGFIEGFVEESE